MATTSNNTIAHAIYEVTKGKTGSELAGVMGDVMKFLVRKRLLSRSPGIVTSLEKIINKEEGILKAKVLSARKLEHDTKSHIIQDLEKRYGAKKIILEEEINEKLLGGIKIEIGDEIIDLTLKNKINKLQEHLTRIK